TPPPGRSRGFERLKCAQTKGRRLSRPLQRRLSRRPYRARAGLRRARAHKATISSRASPARTARSAPETTLSGARSSFKSERVQSTRELLLRVRLPVRLRRDRAADDARDGDERQDVRERLEERRRRRGVDRQAEGERRREAEQERRSPGAERPPVAEDHRRERDEAASLRHVLG